VKNDDLCLSVSPPQVAVSSALKAAKMSPLIEKVNDHKDFKKLLRTRTNVLVLYTKSGQSISKLLFFRCNKSITPFVAKDAKIS